MLLEIQVLLWDMHKKCGGIKPVYEIPTLPILIILRGKKFVSDLGQVVGLLWVLQFPPPINLTATILLKYC
jgi:hypothetical protein